MPHTEQQSYIKPRQSKKVLVKFGYDMINQIEKGRKNLKEGSTYASHLTGKRAMKCGIGTFTASPKP